MDEYPFFFDQPWPFVMSMIGFAGAALSAIAALRARRAVRDLIRANNALRFVLMLKDAQHEMEVRYLIEQLGGEPLDGAGGHTIQ